MARTEIKLPQSGMGMADGTILVWHVSVGQRIQQGQPLCDIEAAKATIEMEAPASGVVLELLVREGDNVAVNTTIVILDEAGPGGTHFDGSPQLEQMEIGPSVSPGPPQKLAEYSNRDEETRVKVEPRARIAARQHGIDLNLVRGSGPDGRITEADVLRYVQETSGPPPLPDSPHD